MNILLFEPGEEQKPLPASDPRAHHLREILKVRPGQEVRAGIVAGDTGTIVIEEIVAGAVRFSWRPGPGDAPRQGGASGPRDAPRQGGAPGPAVAPGRPAPGSDGPTLAPGKKQGSVKILLGHPRPPVLRRLLKDLTTLGVDEILVTLSNLSEKSYLQSKVWGDRPLRAALIDGASQAGVTTIPTVRRFHSLRRALEELPPGGMHKNLRRADVDTGGAGDPPGSVGDLRLLLDPGAPEGLYTLKPGIDVTSVVFAAGPERGWSDDERAALLQAGFKPVTIGPRTLRTETAALVGAAFLLWLLGMELGSGAEE